MIRLPLAAHPRIDLVLDPVEIGRAHQDVGAWRGHADSNEEECSIFILGRKGKPSRLPRRARGPVADDADVAVRQPDVLKLAGVKAPVIFGIGRPAVRGDGSMLVEAAKAVWANGLCWSRKHSG